MTEVQIPSIDQQPKTDVPVSDDPRMFFDSFRQSESYKNAYEQRLSKLSPSPDVTEDELRDAFEETEDAKGAMLDFAQHEMHFRYISTKFDEESRDAVDLYIGSVEHLLRTMRSGDVSGGGRTEDKEAIMDADNYRSVKHNALAKALKNHGYTSTEKLGRTMARLILIDKKLDNFDNASINDLERSRRFIAG